MTELKVFVDCDGVLAAFSQHVLDRLGVRPGLITDDEMWELIAAIPDFWPTIPVKYGAHDLMNFLKPYSPIVLTGCPKNHYEAAAAHKVEWVARHFGDVPVITCLSRNKPLYMHAAGDILIDDFSTNIRRWVNAGGVGVHYRRHLQGLTDFKIAVGFTDDVKSE